MGLEILKSLDESIAEAALDSNSKQAFKTLKAAFISQDDCLTLKQAMHVQEIVIRALTPLSKAIDTAVDQICQLDGEVQKSMVSYCDIMIGILLKKANRVMEFLTERLLDVAKDPEVQVLIFTLVGDINVIIAHCIQVRNLEVNSTKFKDE